MSIAAIMAAATARVRSRRGAAKLVAQWARVGQRTAEAWFEGVSMPQVEQFAWLAAADRQLEADFQALIAERRRLIQDRADAASALSRELDDLFRLRLGAADAADRRLVAPHGAALDAGDRPLVSGDYRGPERRRGLAFPSAEFYAAVGR